jgi:hypothetical protein
MDIWNLVASIASILSLLLFLSRKGNSVRKFTVPLTTALVGFSLGRNSSDFGQASSLLFQDPYLLFMLGVFLILVGLSMYLVETNKFEARSSFIFFVLISMFIVPQLIRNYNDIAPMISTQDYLTLARVKENTGDVESAIKYLKIYSRRVGRVELEKQVSNKIHDLRKRQFKEEFKKTN